MRWTSQNTTSSETVGIIEVITNSLYHEHHTGQLVQFTSRSHPAKRLNALVHCHLGSVPVLKLQFLVLLTTFGDILIDPVECVRHVVVVLRHTRSVADRVGDDGAIRLNEIDL